MILYDIDETNGVACSFISSAQARAVIAEKHKTSNIRVTFRISYVGERT
jgi:hypothetical protein